MQEIWKDVVGYEGLYQVSNLGRVKTIPHTTVRKNGSRLSVPEKMLHPGKDNSGYLLVVLADGKTTKSCRVHRLVAEVFVENPNPKEFIYVNHKDESRDNNVYTNLEWCTNQYNITYGQALKKQSVARKGKPLSKEHCRRISESLKGRKSPMLGRHQTEEAKQKISVSMKKYRQKQREALSRRLTEMELTRIGGK